LLVLGANGTRRYKEALGPSLPIIRQNANRLSSAPEFQHCGIGCSSDRVHYAVTAAAIRQYNASLAVTKMIVRDMAIGMPIYSADVIKVSISNMWQLFHRPPLTHSQKVEFLPCIQ